MKRIYNPWEKIEGYQCFGCAPANKAGVRMSFYADDNDVISVWRPEPQFQGWLNTLHGGVQAVLLDEICGWVVISQCQTCGFTSRMETKYLKPISTNEPYLLLRARIRERKRNILFIEAEIFNTRGELCSSALCAYYTLSPEKARSEMFFKEVCIDNEDLTLDEVIRRTVSHPA